MRAQTSLPALGVAFVLLTAGLVLGIAAADGALGGADRSALDRQAAVALSDRLVGADGPLATRGNVLAAPRVRSLSVETLRDQYGLSERADVRVTLGDRTLVSAGNPAGGVTVERIVLIERRETRTIAPSFDGGRTMTLPRRTPSVNLTVRPAGNTTVRTVRIGGRVRLHDPSGLDGTYDLPVSTLETARIRFEGAGSLENASIRVRYRPTRTRKARLGVTVDG